MPSFDKRRIIYLRVMKNCSLNANNSQWIVILKCLARFGIRNSPERPFVGQVIYENSLFTDCNVGTGRNAAAWSANKFYVLTLRSSGPLLFLFNSCLFVIVKENGKHTEWNIEKSPTIVLLLGVNRSNFSSHEILFAFLPGNFLPGSCEIHLFRIG